MATNVLMPQMGESIAEGTIVRWIKKVGDRVDRDEPLFEISTDKVDAEIPSPAAGVLTEIKAKEGDTIPVNEVVAVIGEAGAPEASAPRGHSPAAVAPAAPASQAAAPPAPSPAPARPPVTSAPPVAAPATGEVTAPAASREELRRQKSSPLVRRIASEHGVDISQLSGTGIGGRVTKQDILDYIDSGSSAPSAQAPSPATVTAAAAGQQPLPATASTGSASGGAGVGPATTGVPPAWGVKPAAQDEVVPMTIMRRRIAEHMVLSKRTSAHVHSVFEVDFSKVSKIRQAHKEDYERVGAKLTYLPFIVKAIVNGLREVPIVNASVEGENIIYHKAINIGIAVALDWGLIVPVVKQADELNILGLSRTMADLANRARNKQLKPEEVQGGTFTITNPGVFGALFGMPVISQPQVAILGVGAVEKRVVVVGDAIAVRPMAYLSLGYDHRVIDGAVADAFMSIVKKQLENFDSAAL
jgi:2-oxoglutarate dehydrogenase E2 component (dihydrolipoamide succinyltransferase)